MTYKAFDVCRFLRAMLDHRVLAYTRRCWSGFQLDNNCQIAVEATKQLTRLSKLSVAGRRQFTIFCDDRVR